jgi:parallel beta-helix repeat protein
VTRDANLSFRGTRRQRLVVRSWNRPQGRPDYVLRDGRASIAVRGQGRLDALDTSFERLGFYEGTLSGLALWARGDSFGTGRTIRSRFAHNYFGAYTFGSKNMRWAGNQFVDNDVYGFDPHDMSRGFLVEDNYAARNGRHGIIFSRNCNHNVIRGNLSEGNGWHGIVLDDGKAADGPSNFNEIYRNVVRGNAKVGIQVDGSAHNHLSRNRITGSRYGLRVFGPSGDNRITRNSVGGAADIGVMVDNPSRGTLVHENQISDTSIGIRVRGTSGTRISENEIRDVVSHGVKVDGTGVRQIRGVVIADNEIRGRGPSPILVEGAGEHTVSEHGNQASWNYPLAHDIARLLVWRVGLGIWLLLLLAVLCGPLIVVAAERASRSGRQAG